jgi:hypothetical protein
LRACFSAALLLVASCSRSERQAGAANAPESTAVSERAPPAVEQNVLDREDVIVAALHAATAAALGRDDRDGQSELKGRRFEVRMRFACPGLGNRARSAVYDDKGQVLRVKVRSDLTDQKLPASDLLRRNYEGGVGFVLGQPWLLSSGCPAASYATMGSGEPTIVLAQLFTPEESRVQRPAASYDLTTKLKPEDAPQGGLDLVVSGRLAALADGRPVHCAATDGAPACVVSAKIDRVAVQRPDGGAILGEWGLGLAPQ